MRLAELSLLLSPEKWCARSYPLYVDAMALGRCAKAGVRISKSIVEHLHVSMGMFGTRRAGQWMHIAYNYGYVL